MVNLGRRRAGIAGENGGGGTAQFLDLSSGSPGMFALNSFIELCLEQ